MRWTAFRFFRAASRQWLIRRKSSARMESGVPRRRSRVTPTVPSREFSTGTTPQSALPFSTSSKTWTIDGRNAKAVSPPKCARAAKCVKEASGPKQATRIGPCRARETDSTSWKIAAS